MGYFFFDESIHERGGFALGAWVYTESDPSAEVKLALENAGLISGTDEFKSGAHVGRDPRQAEARNYLQSVLGSAARIGVAILPTSAVQFLGREALVALQKLLNANNLMDEHHTVYLDQGLFSSQEEAFDSARAVGLNPHISLCPECDSKLVLGLQLADLAAHALSTMLLAQQGIITKTVKTGENSGYDPDEDMPLGFELRASVRYNFLSGAPPDPDTWKSQQIGKFPSNPTVCTSPIFVAPSSPKQPGNASAICTSVAYINHVTFF